LVQVIVAQGRSYQELCTRRLREAESEEFQRLLVAPLDVVQHQQQGLADG
jgi:hypothetical protein